MVAAMFNSALEALLRHDSVRASNGESMQNAALREHNDAEALRGASWNPTKQRWRAQIYYPGRLLHLGYFQHVEHAAKAYDLMAIKLRGMHTPLNFVPETYSDMCELLAQVDQMLLLELLQSFSRTKNKLLVESARQQQRMDWEAAFEASDPTMGIDWEDAAPTATTHPCQPSPPLAPHSAAGCGMAMGDDVATRFDAALDAVLRHTSVRVPSNLNRLLLGRQHNGAGGLCGATYDKNKQCWQAKIKHCSRTYHLGSFQCGEHAAKAHDLMAIKCRGMHTPLNFVSKTYNDMYELLAQMEQPLLLKLLRAVNRKNKKLLAEAGRQQGSTIQEAALTASDPAMNPDWSDASSPTATTRPRQAGQPLAPPSAAARAKAKCSIEALGWPCDAAGSDAAASLPPSKRPRRSAMALIGSAPLGSSAQGTSTGRCPSAAAVCADTTASNGYALGKQSTRAAEEEEEAGEGQLAMTPASWSPSIQATGQPAVSSFRQRLQLLLSQQRCTAPSECAASAAASWDD